MPDFKNYYEKFPFLSEISWIKVFSLLPLIVAILIFLVLMILNEV